MRSEVVVVSDDKEAEAEQQATCNLIILYRRMVKTELNALNQMQESTTRL